MFRSQYDTDVTVWSPQGRLLQVEYAMEAVKQGSACLGLVGKDGVVLAALKRQPNELSGHQKKLLKIDDHLVIAVAGLNADARTLAKVMRTECLNHRYVYGAPLQGARLVQDIADKYQRCTQTYVRRPYGVGLLVACCDATGPHLYETCPSGNFSEFVAVAIGARAQSAKTYLEKHHKTFKDTPVEELCTHALQALAGCVAGDKELDAAAASLAVVTADGQSRLIEDSDVQKYLDLVEVERTAAQTEGMELEGASA
jgi:20S proteasome subunit alpha 6